MAEIGYYYCEFDYENWTKKNKIFENYADPPNSCEIIKDIIAKELDISVNCGLDRNDWSRYLYMNWKRHQ